MAVQGSLVTAPNAFCAAVPGSTIPGTSAPRTATGTPPPGGSSMLVSVWPGRSRHESSPPYFGGSGLSSMGSQGTKPLDRIYWIAEGAKRCR